MAHESFLRYANFRHLKLSVAGLAAAVIAYAAYDPVGGRNGGTVVGYVLGTVAAVMILWLMWFGVRKRSYYSRGAPLAGWLSAHVYLGATLLLIVPLHSGFEFGWNVHTLAYALMATVILSGMVGVLLYNAVPTPMTSNRPGQKIAALLQQIADVDAEVRGLASGLPDVFARAAQDAIEGTGIGGGMLRRLSARAPKDGTARALEAIRAHRETLSTQQREKVERLVEVLSLKRTLLGRVRRDVRYKTLLEMWLWLHIPVSFATVVAVTLHVISVFYYW